MGALTGLFGILLFVTAMFLILLVLVQRGRGGGLAGALGGMGGQSAFGTKAGDLFTRITIVVAAFWILLCISAILVLNRQSSGGARRGGIGNEYTPVESRSEEGDTEPVSGIGGVGDVPAEDDPDAGADGN